MFKMIKHGLRFLYRLFKRKNINNGSGDNNNNSNEMVPGHPPNMVRTGADPMEPVGGSGNSETCYLEVEKQLCLQEQQLEQLIMSVKKKMLQPQLLQQPMQPKLWKQPLLWMQRLLQPLELQQLSPQQLQLLLQQLKLQLQLRRQQLRPQPLPLQRQLPLLSLQQQLRLLLQQPQLWLLLLHLPALWLLQLQQLLQLNEPLIQQYQKELQAIAKAGGDGSGDGSVDDGGSDGDKTEGGGGDVDSDGGKMGTKMEPNGQYDCHYRFTYHAGDENRYPVGCYYEKPYDCSIIPYKVLV